MRILTGRGMALVLMVALLVEVVHADQRGLDYPHNSSKGYGCNSCHYILGETAFSWLSGEQDDIDDTLNNNMCRSCHNNVTAPRMETHSSWTTSERHGVWAVECRVCHWPHHQKQLRSYGAASYLTNGTSSEVTTYTLRSAAAEWQTDALAGNLLIPDTTKSYQYKIDSNTRDTITVDQAIDTVVKVGTKPFAVVHGKLVNSTIDLGRITTVAPKVAKSGSKAVKFFRPTGNNSFADGDATYDGICEVCHTETDHYRNDGSGSDQSHANLGGKNGTDCFDCHLHTAGFHHGGGGGGSSCGTVDSCHGLQDSHPTHLAASAMVEATCASCHDTDSFPTFNDGQELAATTACAVCHAAGAATAKLFWEKPGSESKAAGSWLVANGDAGYCGSCHNDQNADHNNLNASAGCNECHTPLATKANMVSLHDSGACSLCHLSVEGHATATITAGKSGGGNGAVECTGCHSAAGVNGMHPGVTGESAGTVHDMLGVSNHSEEKDCANCHAMATASERINLHGASPCNRCHQSVDPDVIAAIAGGRAGNPVYCETCHDAKGQNRLHGLTDDNGPDGVADVHDNLNSAAGAWVSSGNTIPAYRAAAYSGKLDFDTYGGLLDADYNCADCHAANRTAITDLEAIQLHTRANGTGFGDCRTCHAASAIKDQVDNGRESGHAKAGGLNQNIECEDCHKAAYDAASPSGQKMYQYDGERHHATRYAQAGDCVHCHADPRPVAVTRGFAGTAALSGTPESGWHADYGKPVGFDDATSPKQPGCRLCHTNAMSYSVEVYGGNGLHGYNLTGSAAQRQTGLTVWKNDFYGAAITSFPNGPGNVNAVASPVSQSQVHRIEANNATSLIQVENMGACLACHSVQLSHAAPKPWTDFIVHDNANGANPNGNYRMPYDTLRYGPGRSIFGTGTDLRGSNTISQDWNDHRITVGRAGYCNGDLSHLGCRDRTRPGDGGYLGSMDYGSWIFGPPVYSWGATVPDDFKLGVPSNADFNNFELLSGLPTDGQATQQINAFPNIAAPVIPDGIHVSRAYYNGLAGTLVVEAYSDLGAGQTISYSYTGGGCASVAMTWDGAKYSGTCLSPSGWTVGVDTVTVSNTGTASPLDVAIRLVDGFTPAGAVADSYSVLRNHTTSLAVMANDAGTGIELTAIDQTNLDANCVAAINGTNVEITCGATPGPMGSFTYTVKDDWDGTSTATVAVNVGELPSLAVSQPDGEDDGIADGGSYNITYTLQDVDSVVTVAFYYDTDNVGLNGTAIPGACASAAEGMGVTCTWDSTGVPSGAYYVYGVTSDGLNPAVTAYSAAPVIINCANPVVRSEWTNIWGNNFGAETGSLNNYAIPAGSQANRLLLVTVTNQYPGTAWNTWTVTYGGQTLTEIANVNGSHTTVWMGYLKESGIDAATNSNFTLNMTGDGRYIAMFVKVLDYVDQTTPISAFITGSSGAGGYIQASGPVAWFANDRVEYGAGAERGGLAASANYTEAAEFLNGAVGYRTSTASDGSETITVAADTLGPVAMVGVVVKSKCNTTPDNITISSAFYDGQFGTLTVEATNTLGAGQVLSFAYTGGGCADVPMFWDGVKYVGICDTPSGWTQGVDTVTVDNTLTGSTSDYDTETVTGFVPAVAVADSYSVMTSSTTGLAVKSNDAGTGIVLDSTDDTNLDANCSTAINGNNVDLTCGAASGAMGSFSYTIRDSRNLTSSATVTISIGGPPTLSISQPDGVADSLAEGDIFNIIYTLADDDSAVTAAFYYSADNSGLNGTAITGACATAGEGVNVSCAWNTTNVPSGAYYIYGRVSDGVHPEVTAYSSGPVCIGCTNATVRNEWTNIWGNNNGAITGSQDNYPIPTGSNANRLLLVAVTNKYPGAAWNTWTVTYGGQQFTEIASLNGNNITVWMGYLKESGIDAATNSNFTLNMTGNGRYIAMFVKVLDFIDQTSPISASINGSSGSGGYIYASGPVAWSANDRVEYAAGAERGGLAAAANYTEAAEFLNGAVGYRTSTLSDGSETITIAADTLGPVSMVGAVLKSKCNTTPDSITVTNAFYDGQFGTLTVEATNTLGAGQVLSFAYTGGGCASVLMFWDGVKYSGTCNSPSGWTQGVDTVTVSNTLTGSTADYDTETVTGFVPAAAVVDSYSVVQSRTTSLAVMANDTGTGIALVSTSDASLNANCSTAVNGNNVDITCGAATGAMGSFSYTIRDSRDLSSTATVTVISIAPPPPTASALSPANGSTGIAVGSNLTLTLTADPGTSLDWTTFQIQLTGTRGYAKTYTDLETAIVTKTGTAASYDVTVNPDADFTYGEVITVTVNISDLAASAMIPPAWSFTVALAPPGAVAYWRLNDGTSGSTPQTAADSIGSYTATLGSTAGADTNDPVWTTSGKLENALSCDGVDNYATTTMSINESGTQAYTFEAWVYPTVTGAAYRNVVSTENGGNDWSVYHYNGAWMVNNGSGGWTPAGMTVDVNQWQHLVVSFIPGTGIKFYKNGGAPVTSATIAYDASTAALNIGRSPSAGQYFSGRIDEVVIYDRALTQAEVTARYNAGDTDAPTISNQSPQVSTPTINSTLSFVLADSNSGVEWNSFTIQLTGNLGYARTYTDLDTAVVTKTGTAASYTITVAPETAFGDGEVITATVQVNDAKGNTLTSAWSFTKVYSAAVPSGAIAYWKFDEGIGQTIYDYIGTRHAQRGDTTSTEASDPTFVAGRLDDGLSFDGGDWVETSVNVLNDFDSFTLEAWAKWNSGTGYMWIFGEASGNWFLLGKQTGQNAMHVNIAGVTAGVQMANSAIFDGGWHHVVLTNQAGAVGGLKLYVDGTLRDTKNSGGSPTLNTTINLGRRSSGEYWSGVIDEAIIYNRALSLAEIEARYNATRP